LAPLIVTAAVEGIADEAVARRVVQSVGLDLGRVHGKLGKHALDRGLKGYNSAARFAPWLVLRDLDHDADCAPELCAQLVPSKSSQLALRVPVRSVESWLLADREAIAKYLGVQLVAAPSSPEDLNRPKRSLVDLARKSRRGDVRRDMVPAEGISCEVGPAYAARLIEFALGLWRPEVAAQRSDSLARCLRALRALA
jgi:hypothetical protein